VCHQCTRTLLTKCVSCNFGIYRYRYNYENIHNKIVSSPSQRDNGNNNKGSVKRGGPVVGHRAHRQKKVRYNAFTIHFATLNYLQIHLSLRQTIPDTNRTPSTITRAEHEHVLVCVTVCVCARRPFWGGDARFRAQHFPSVVVCCCARCPFLNLIPFHRHALF